MGQAGEKRACTMGQAAVRIWAEVKGDRRRKPWPFPTPLGEEVGLKKQLLGLISCRAQKWGCLVSPGHCLPPLHPIPFLMPLALSQHTPAPGHVCGAALLAPSAPGAEVMLCSPAWVMLLLSTAPELLPLSLGSFSFSWGSGQALEALLTTTALPKAATTSNKSLFLCFLQ